MMREGMFTACFLAVTPILKSNLQPYCANDYAASLLAGIGAGLGATIASHGSDTIKTIQQGAKPSQPVNLRAATQQIISTGGFAKFFKGAVPRGSRVVSAVTIMGLVNEKMEDMFRLQNTDSQQPQEDKPRNINKGL
jgi:solute carrier family 25 citrate transporter 1